VAQFTPLKWLNSVRQGGSTSSDAVAQLGRYLQETFCGLPIVAFEDLSKIYSPNDYSILLSVGFKKVNNLRSSIYRSAKSQGYSIASYISRKAIIQTNQIGEGNIIFEGSIIGPYCKIGVGNIIRSGANISHDCEMGNFNYIAPSACIAGNVIIGNNTFIGVNSTVRNEIFLADYTVIGAAAYVNRSTKEKEVIVPSKSITLEKNSFEINFG